MSLLTVEVELENGVVRPCGTDTLPVKARALLTIIGTAKSEPPTAGSSFGERLQHLCGIGNGEYTDLSTNKAHLDELGR